MTTRGGLTEAQYQLLLPHLPPVKPHRGRPNIEHLHIINAILWFLRTGAPWRDLPDYFPRWKTVHSRFSRWIKLGIWSKILQKLQSIKQDLNDIDWDINYIGSTLCRAHRHAAGARRQGRSPQDSARSQALGRSVGGFSTKVHIRVKGKGCILNLKVTPGQDGDAPELISLLKEGKVKNMSGGRAKQKPKRIVADKAYNSKMIRNWCWCHSIMVTIPKKKN